MKPWNWDQYSVAELEKMRDAYASLRRQFSVWDEPGTKYIDEIEAVLNASEKDEIKL